MGAMILRASEPDNGFVRPESGVFVEDGPDVKRRLSPTPACLPAFW
jgi:hypothetical protein